MASPKTLELRIRHMWSEWRMIPPRETRERDRSLRGKARRRARKEARRAEG